MTDDERWERLEARWERMDARWERFEARCQRSDAELAVQGARTEQAFQDLHEYMTEATQILAELAKSVKSTGRIVHEHRTAFEEESRAHREALWAMIDRLNGGSGPEPA